MKRKPRRHPPFPGWTDATTGTESCAWTRVRPSSYCGSRKITLNRCDALAWTIVALSLAAAALAALIGRRLATGIVSRLEVLSRGALRIQRGMMDRPFDLEGEDEVGRLARAMERMRTGIQRRDEQLRLMLSRVAHEIRNPLAGLELFAAAAQDTDDREERRRILGRVRREVVGLNSIINEFLGFARPGRTELELHDVRDPGWRRRVPGRGGGQGKGRRIACRISPRAACGERRPASGQAAGPEPAPQRGPRGGAGLGRGRHGQRPGADRGAGRRARVSRRRSGTASSSPLWGQGAGSRARAGDRQGNGGSEPRAGGAGGAGRGQGARRRKRPDWGRCRVPRILQWPRGPPDRWGRDDRGRRRRVRRNERSQAGVDHR